MSFEDFKAGLQKAAECRLANLITLSAVDSTNRLARRVVEDYEREELTIPRLHIVAYEQLSGRGRQGRFWQSPAGLGVYATVLTSVESGARLEHLPLMVSTALAESIASVTDEPCEIKWPNDLLVRGRKIGGILIEAVHGLQKDQSLPLAIIGLGVNHGHDEENLPTTRSTSLRLEASSCPDLGSSAAMLLLALEEQLSATDWGVERYRRLSVHKPGELVRCRLQDVTVEGRFRGFDDRGHLQLEEEGELRTIPSGEVVES